MFGGGSNKPKARIDSLVGHGTVVDGDLSFTGGLRVDGWVKGNVRSTGGEPATLVLSEKARIEGEIHVSHALINGAVLGPVHATEYLELQVHAKVQGDVHYRSLEIQVGAVVQGRLVHEDGTHSATLLALPRAPEGVDPPMDGAHTDLIAGKPGAEQ